MGLASDQGRDGDRFMAESIKLALQSALGRHHLLEMGASAPAMPSPSPTSLSLGRSAANLHYGIMDRYRERTSIFFARLAYGFSRKRGRSPAPQTCLSTSSSRISSLGRWLIYSASSPQFLNSQTSLSFPSFPTSPRIFDAPTLHDFEFKMN